LANAIHAILKPAGLFSVVNWHQRPREETTIFGEPRGPKSELRMSPAQTIESVQRSGFSLAQVVEILPYHYGAVFQKSVP
jgi:predicted methyltransferase